MREFYLLWRIRQFVAVCSLTSVLLIAGCTSPVQKLTHAQRLQLEGKYTDAVREYSSVLARVPESQPQAISLIRMHIAECQWALGEPKAALLSLQNALAADPESRVARLRMGELMLAGGAPQTAADHAKWVLSRDPSSTDALTLLGAAYAASGAVGQAQTMFEQVLKNDPGRVNVSLALAQIHAAGGDELKARHVLYAAAAAHPDNSAPWLALARTEEERGNSVAAEENYRKAVGAGDDRESKLRLAQFLARASRISEAEQVLAHLDQNFSPVSTLRADFELLLGRAVEAVREYKLTLQHPSSSDPSPAEKAPEEPAPTRPLVIARLIEAELSKAHREVRRADSVASAKALFARYNGELDAATSESLQAEIAVVSGDLAQAQVHAGRAVELAPESAPANFVAGLVQHAARDLPEANRLWQTALEKDPDYLPARQAVAARALAAGDVAGAEAYILPVVRQEPANFQALCIYAGILERKQQFEAARLIARRAMAADATAAQPHIILGNVAMAQNRVASAFIEYQQAILLEPNSAEAMAGLTRVYRRGKITRPMLRRMERVAASAPASPSLMEIVGRLYADHGWHNDAERALRQATQLDSSRSTAAAALALTYANHGKQRAAADSLSSTEESADLLAGLRAAEQKDAASAMGSYEAAVERGESSGAAANNLAWMYAQNGIKLDRALELAQLARRLAPRDPAVLDTMGVVQLKRREYSQAVETLKQAVELAASNAGKQPAPELLQELKLHLAEAYLRSGQPQAAAALKNQ